MRGTSPFGLLLDIIFGLVRVPGWVRDAEQARTLRRAA